MKIVVLGAAGMIGKVICRDLADYGEVGEIVVADIDEAAAKAVAAGLGGKAKAARADVTDAPGLTALLRGAGCCINSVNYYFNLDVMRVCLEAKVHYVDLGGLFHMTRRQLELDGAFRDAGLTAILGLGSCPGIANVHAGYLGAQLDAVDSIRIYNGATPDVGDSLAPAYTLQTIFDEITQPAMVFRDGEFLEVAPVSEAEHYPFREPIGYARTHLSLHSEVATIPHSLKNKGIKECFFKITAFGYSEKAFEQLKFLANLGLMSADPIEVTGEVPILSEVRTLSADAKIGAAASTRQAVRVKPRDVLMKALAHAPASEKHGSLGFKDIATEARGTKDGREVTLRIDTTAWPKKEWNISGGTFLVASPPVIVARWLADGRVERQGVLAPEVAVEPEAFFAELGRRGARTEVTKTGLVSGEAAG
ncbi:MAG: saccharopine dehydrogenase NADP-binding domain-containing protein [Chloroflexi bacterium]|nr:saccharopine dehydrogenase NADP-binding domain-containing protein [Chloroflexota bacterium]